MTSARNHFQQGVQQLYRSTAKLNLYVQRIQPQDNVRVTAELKNISIQINELITQVKPDLHGGCISKKT